MNPKPGWLTAVCVVAIVLGGVGLMTSMFGAVNLFFGPQLQKRMQRMVQFTQQKNQPPGMAEIQEKMQNRIIEVQQRWLTVNLVVMTFNLILSSCLLFGGIKALQLAPWGRTMLLWSFAAIILFHLLRLVPNIGMQMATVDVMEEFMADLMQQTATQGKKAVPPAQMRTITNITSISMRLGIAIGIAYTVVIELVQIACYAFGIYYLRRPHIRALYANQEGAALVEPLV